MRGSDTMWKWSISRRTPGQRDHLDPLLGLVLDQPEDYFTAPRVGHDVPRELGHRRRHEGRVGAGEAGPRRQAARPVAGPSRGDRASTA